MLGVSLGLVLKGLIPRPQVGSRLGYNVENATRRSPIRVLRMRMNVSNENATDP